jgi:hypothetical protein
MYGREGRGRAYVIGNLGRSELRETLLDGEIEKAVPRSYPSSAGVVRGRVGTHLEARRCNVQQFPGKCRRILDSSDERTLLPCATTSESIENIPESRLTLEELESCGGRRYVFESSGQRLASSSRKVEQASLGGGELQDNI